MTFVTEDIMDPAVSLLVLRLVQPMESVAMDSMELASVSHVDPTSMELNASSVRLLSKD